MQLEYVVWIASPNSDIINNPGRRPHYQPRRGARAAGYLRGESPSGAVHYHMQLDGIGMDHSPSSMGVPALPGTYANCTANDVWLYYYRTGRQRQPPLK